MTKTPEELTEDWEAGKLKYGWYWVDNSKRGIVPDQYIPGYNWLVSAGSCIDKILAPCNYDEQKAMQAELAELKEKVADQRADLESSRWYQTVQNEDIGKLRDLLRECLAHLSVGKVGTSVTPINVLLTRINAALGESEEQ